jgi:hypothetical protein
VITAAAQITSHFLPIHATFRQAMTYEPKSRNQAQCSLERPDCLSRRAECLETLPAKYVNVRMAVARAAAVAAVGKTVARTVRCRRLEAGARGGAYTLLERVEQALL